MLIAQGVKKLMLHIEKEGYKGFDPYDALKSPLFKLPFFNSNKFIRFGIQQLVKRLPFNIRPLLLVPKGYNPVTLGLSIQAYSYSILSEPKNGELYFQKITGLVNDLKGLAATGYSGACWGYDFDWQARNATIPAYQPSVVATGIITNALFVAYQITGHKESARLIGSAAKFVINDLQRTHHGEDAFCFSYSPFDSQQVFNASMKGARLLAQSYSISQNPEHKNLATKAVQFVMSHQKENGAWVYSLAREGGWIDNYHTGYILDCLHEYQKLTGNHQWSTQIKLGYSFYREHFISKEGEPKFYHNKIYPVDCTAAAQTILTTLKFDDVEIAEKTAKWMIKNMQKENGSFVFRKFNYYTVRTSYMRWSDAWMFAGLAYFLSKFK